MEIATASEPKGRFDQIAYLDKPGQLIVPGRQNTEFISELTLEEAVRRAPHLPQARHALVRNPNGTERVQQLTTYPEGVMGTVIDTTDTTLGRKAFLLATFAPRVSYQQSTPPTSLKDYINNGSHYRLEFPGGGVKDCQTLQEAIADEVAEEAGVAVPPEGWIMAVDKSKVSVANSDRPITGFVAQAEDATWIGQNPEASEAGTQVLFFELNALLEVAKNTDLMPEAASRALLYQLALFDLDSYRR